MWNQLQAWFSNISSRQISRCVGISAFIILAASVITWYLTIPRLPSTIRLATGGHGGTFDLVGRHLAEELEREAGRKVEIVRTSGSLENFKLLEAAEVDLAFLSGSAPSSADIKTLSPLYDEMVFVIVRKDSGISTIRNFEQERVIVGSPGSGSRHNADLILKHYNVTPLRERVPADFEGIATVLTVGAAIETTGLLNPSLRKLLDSDDFNLLPIYDSEALSMLHPHLRPASIPRGLFHGDPPVPAIDIPTVALTARLSARTEANSLLVRTALDARFSPRLAEALPTLVSYHEAREQREPGWHPAAREFFEPYDGLGDALGLLETLAALKELFVAALAGAYLLWERWRRLRLKEEKEQAEAARAVERAEEQRQAAVVAAQKERLDEYLQQTFAIERAQMTEEHPAQLNAYLNELSELQIQALNELTHEELRGDRMFSIFLQQCNTLSRKIENRLLLAASIG